MGRPVGTPAVEVTPFDFRIQVETVEGRALLPLAGDVDLATASIVMNRVEALSANRSRPLPSTSAA